METPLLAAIPPNKRFHSHSTKPRFAERLLPLSIGRRFRHWPIGHQIQDVKRIELC